MMNTTRFTTAIFCAVLFAGCSSTGGELMTNGQETLTPGKAIVTFSAQVTDGTTYDNCSVFVGRSAASSKWFAFPVQEDTPVMVALEVEPGEYGFHRFGCMFRGFQLSSGVSGPQLNVAAGDVIYLGRLVVSGTEMGSAAGYSRMPSSVELTFIDRQDEDLEMLGQKWPVFSTQVPRVSIPSSWGGDTRYALRPYQDGVKLVAAPII